MCCFGWCLAERYRYLATPERFQAAVEGEENWRSAFAGGRGAVVVTAHIGPWENAVRFGATDAKRRIHVVREKELDPRAQEFVREIVSRSGDDYTTHFADDDPALGLELVKALRAGDIVALQGDRPRTGGQSHQVAGVRSSARTFRSARPRWLARRRFRSSRSSTSARDASGCDRWRARSSTSPAPPIAIVISRPPSSGSPRRSSGRSVDRLTSGSASGDSGASAERLLLGAAGRGVERTPGGRVLQIEQRRGNLRAPRARGR